MTMGRERLVSTVTEEEEGDIDICSNSDLSDCASDEDADTELSSGGVRAAQAGVRSFGIDDILGHTSVTSVARRGAGLGRSPLDALFTMTTNFDSLKQKSDKLELRKDAVSKKKRKSRTAFTNHQIFELERRFLHQKYLSPADRDEISSTLGLSGGQVITWFQNRRAKFKRDVEEMKKDVEKGGPAPVSPPRLPLVPDPLRLPPPPLSCHAPATPPAPLLPGLPQLPHPLPLPLLHLLQYPFHHPHLQHLHKLGDAPLPRSRSPPSPGPPAPAVPPASAGCQPIKVEHASV